MTGPDAAEYRRTVLREFAALKSVDRFDDAVARSLRLSGGRGYLLCVSELHAEDAAAVETLARFRAGVTTFPGTFRVTPEGTKRWLRTAVLDVPDRILFFALGRTGQVIGHLGFAHADDPLRRMELDNVIRGVAGVQPGLMTEATERLIDWAASMFSPAEFRLRVLDDNGHAIRFYSRLGFVPDGTEPLRRLESNGETRCVPVSPGDVAPPDRSYVCMRLAGRRPEPRLRTA
ncbi:MAG TPA: GNAT family N-acetyltransferase [Planctomycetaceae bacterium]